MSRYRVPRLRLMRSLGLDLPGLSRKSIDRRPFPPGQHQGARRKKLRTFGAQLKEKQKLRFSFGITEKQLMRYLTSSPRLQPGDSYAT
jgi:small subunit ribosomal protein S4